MWERVLGLTCLLSDELLDVGLNILQGKYPILGYEVYWCSCGIENHDDICPMFPSILIIWLSMPNSN